VFAPTEARSEPADSAAREKSFADEIRPLLLKHCRECHSEKRAEADLDLTAFATMADVRKQPRAWQKVGEMLDSGQMPPPDASQPTDAERKRLRAWVRGHLTAEAAARAGDPGRVVLRRLSNSEYAYTLRDLTSIDSLDPAREFPVDGAAGEGFTNTGGALVMSPALVTKYFDAAKDVAAHAVLLPDGFRFSPHITRSDWTNDSLARIRAFYREFTEHPSARRDEGGDRVNLQGIVFDTNQGGRLPLEPYFAATLAEREALLSGATTIDAVARQRGLNAKYLGNLWESLASKQPSLLLDGLRARWRASKPDAAPALAAEVAAWQKGLWRFAPVGHIGKLNGPKSWLEPVSPLASKQELKFKIPASPDGKDVVLSLVASGAGDGSEHDVAVWRQPRFVAPGRPDLLLRDVRDVVRELTAHRGRMLADAARHLDAAAEAAAGESAADVAELARKHRLDVDALRAWLELLGIGAGGEIEVKGHFTNKLASAAGYDFIKGWGSHDTPLLLANSSDQHVRIPGNMKPHSVAVHPSPTLRAAVGWRSPFAARMRIEGTVTHAHPECGNGVAWSVELRRGTARQKLADGIAQGVREAKFGPIENVAVRKGDLVSILIGPRDGNHSCDLTAVDLRIAAAGEPVRSWSLAEDVSGDVLAGNPHADRLGNAGVWHFTTEPDKGGDDAGAAIPAGSSLARWQATENADEKRKLAREIQTLLTSAAPTASDSPDAALHRQLTSLGGPLLSGILRARESRKAEPRSLGNPPSTTDVPAATAYGVDPALFGKRLDGGDVGEADLLVRAPSVIEVVLPADLVAGRELVATGALDSKLGAEGSVQLEIVAGKRAREAGLQPSQVTTTVGNGQWTSDNRTASYAAPILVTEGSAARKRVEAAFDEFRRLFPAALCYMKIVPVDEVVTLTLFHREDDQLVRLMLDDAQKARLDRLWDELHFVSHDALTRVDAFAQLMEYATQDADPKVFEPLRKPIHDGAAAFRKLLVDSVPTQIDALIAFAAQAYRRPLADGEERELHALYARLREQELPHDDAFRLTLARILVAPAFLYRIENPVDGAGQGPVSDVELASRLSYFLWSSQPDDELRRAAAEERLRNPDALVAQTRRMLRDGRSRRLAIEFACQWLHIRDFDQFDEKSERHFPEFAALRGPMYEESIRFFTDFFQNDGSVLGILDADHTFLNETLAKHYGVPNVVGAEWRRVDGMRKYSRGGILGQATTLAKQSGASRTSPVLRGNWISETLLGERLPRPPKGVPQLPEDETATEGLTVRQLVEKHAGDAKCAVCHRRIDPLGFSLEGFDAIGKRREKDLGDRPIDTRVKTIDGAELDGIDGLRSYLLTQRRDAFVRQFCRKLLGYALGRSVQLSDEPLLSEMQSKLKAGDHRISVAIETIVLSRQFREIRGRDAPDED